MEYMKHIELENIDEVINGYEIRKSIVAQIVDMTDKVILETIIEFAKSEGVTDLYLLDKEFVKTALLNEVERRKGMTDTNVAYKITAESAINNFQAKTRAFKESDADEDMLFRLKCCDTMDL